MAQPTAREMRRLVREGKALPAPGQDRPGRFPIRNREDLRRAIHAVGRVKPNTEEARAMVRRHIIKRAQQLGLMAMIPDSWKSDGTLRAD